MLADMISSIVELWVFIKTGINFFPVCNCSAVTDRYQRNNAVRVHTSKMLRTQLMGKNADLFPYLSVYCGAYI
jgi:hypothetical protein